MEGEETEINSNLTGPFVKNDPRINREGRPKETEETKAKRKLIKDLVAEYRQALAEALPVITPVLLKQAAKGDIQAIKEVNDRVMGKAPQSTDITSGGEKITPIYGGLSNFSDVQEHNSNQTDIQPQQED
jgi:hypothetical protein